MAKTNQKKLDDLDLRSDRYLDMKISDVANRVLNAEVTRGGKPFTLFQEISGAKTAAIENKAAIAALTELVGQLATGQDIDYERIKEGTREILATETVEVAITVNDKEQP